MGGPGDLDVCSFWSDSRQRFWAMFGVGYIGSGLVVFWLSALFSSLAMLLWIVPALYFGLWGASLGWFVRSCWLKILWPVVAWTGIEYFRCELAPLAFSFGGLGYGQPNLVGFSCASVFGVYGVSAVMVLVGAVAAVDGTGSIKSVRSWFRRVPLVVCMGLSLILPQLPKRPAAHLATVTLQQLAEGYDIAADEVLPLRNQATDLIVWPELTFAGDPRLRQSAWFLKMMQAEAAQAKWGVLFGSLVLTFL